MPALQNDSTHTDDAAADIGSTAQYTYNPFNQRVQTVIQGFTTQFVFNQNGQRVSIWNGSTNTVLREQYYWGSKPVAFYYNGQTYFQHQDWLGTERVRIAYNGASAGSFTSLPFGDAQTAAMTEDTTGAVGSVIGGQLTLVGASAEALGTTALKAVPVAGNLLSAFFAIRDVANGVSDYQACLAGH